MPVKKTKVETPYEADPAAPTLDGSPADGAALYARLNRSSRGSGNWVAPTVVGVVVAAGALFFAVSLHHAPASTTTTTSSTTVASTASAPAVSAPSQTGAGLALNTPQPRAVDEPGTTSTLIPPSPAPRLARGQAAPPPAPYAAPAPEALTTAPDTSTVNPAPVPLTSSPTPNGDAGVAPAQSSATQAAPADAGPPASDTGAPAQQ